MPRWRRRREAAAEEEKRIKASMIIKPSAYEVTREKLYNLHCFTIEPRIFIVTFMIKAKFV